MSSNPTDTPEHIASYPRAPVWRHLLAMVYDLFLIIPLLMLTSAVLVWIYGPVETATERAVPAWQQWVLALAALIAFFGIFWRQQGQTLGMQAWRVKLVAQHNANKRVTWGQAIIRVAVACLPLLTALLPFIFYDVNNAPSGIYVMAAAIAVSGMLWRFTNTSRHYLHDKLSGTELLQTPKRKKS